ncbi:DUF3570 domain-containing protein [Agitococcus lubricus]|uniref:Uncharacterized protein DUF3570 n=1 Tax=Agitococcus lubricus TaxID=1077255 RepID=A0A2T5J1Z2_9GAMM|nr:DUF3570 domain-containing protein [Agitococcus lubricus]PTQ90447.1 uncharacterized protein DUF3570 [Agitococcus lubricus]
MQLTAKKAQSMRAALAAASCGLLGLSGAVSAADTVSDKAWQVDTAVLYYKEDNGRVSAAEPIVNFKKDYGDERILNLKVTLDSLTGASPNGATSSSQPQTFTGPSGNKAYTTAPNSQPLDGEFKDTRAAVHANWEQPLGEDYKASIGGGISSEFDFKSLSLNGAISKDINNKNTTLSAGLNLELDSLNPVGGKPTAFSAMTANSKEGNDNKTVIDALFGVTQVINRKTIMQWNYSLSTSSGYHTDPYKVLSLVDGTTGFATDYLYENRPDSRTRHSLFWQTKYHLTEDVIDVSYRFMTDDWGINSHTLDLRYRYELGNDSYLEPHLRFYTQSAADFYRYFLVHGQALPEFASADPRLGEFDATTFGIKYGKKLSKDREFSVRVEQYSQSGNSSPSEAIGQLKTQNLFPDLNALVVQFGYSFKF